MHEQNAFNDPELQHDPNKPHRVRLLATVKDHNGEPALSVVIPLRELAKAKRGTGQHRNIGFSLDIEFTHPNGAGYKLHSAWVALTNQ